jgi:cytochrome oxidase assembly protein ShyY1
MEVLVWILFLLTIWQQSRLDAMEKTLKTILAELQKGAQPATPPLTEAEAELQRRRAAIAEVQENWPTYK